MLRLSATALFVLLTLTAAGQKQRKQSVLLLDGSRISGTIVADSSDYIDIKVITPQVIRVNKSQVSSLEPLAYPGKKSHDTGGYFIHFSASVLAGNNEGGNASSPVFHLSNGYLFENGLGIGFGSGVEKLDGSVIPLYADIRYFPSKRRISPYAWVKSGYGFTTSDPPVTYEFYYGSGGESKGGFLFNVGAGVALYSWQRNAVNIGIGYRYQKITISREDYWWGGATLRETVTRFNRFEIQLGFIFR